MSPDSYSQLVYIVGPACLIDFCFQHVILCEPVVFSFLPASREEALEASLIQRTETGRTMGWSGGDVGGFS